jgi:hypothetical protein
VEAHDRDLLDLIQHYGEGAVGAFAKTAHGDTQGADQARSSSTGRPVGHRADPGAAPHPGRGPARERRDAMQVLSDEGPPTWPRSSTAPRWSSAWAPARGKTTLSAVLALRQAAAASARWC